MLFFILVSGENIECGPGEKLVCKDGSSVQSNPAQQTYNLQSNGVQGDPAQQASTTGGNVICAPLTSVSTQPSSTDQNSGQSFLIQNSTPSNVTSEDCVPTENNTGNQPDEQNNGLDCKLECTVDGSIIDTNENCEEIDKSENITKEMEEVDKVELVSENPPKIVPCVVSPPAQPVVQQPPAQPVVQQPPMQPTVQQPPAQPPMQTVQGFLITPEQQKYQSEQGYIQLQSELQQAQQRLIEKQRQEMMQQQQEIMQRYFQNQINTQIQNYQKALEQQKQQQQQQQQQQEKVSQMNKIKDALQVKAYPIRCELINQSDTQKDSSTKNAVGYKCYTDPQEIIQALINVGYEPDANGRIIATGCRGDEKVEVVYDTKEDPDREPLEGNVTPVNLPEPVK